MNPLPSIESPLRIYYVPFKVMLMDMIENVRIQEELVFKADDSPGTYSSIFSGRIAKEYIERFGKCLFFAVYVDDFSPNSRSSLSSKALTICNIHLLNLPDHFRSKIDSILMTLCCQSNVSKKTNFNYSYDIICSEINTLHGKTITIESEAYTIFFIVFIGDNKEVNAAMGIKNSFHGKSSRPCRSCTATTTQFTRIFEEKSCVKRRTNPPSKFLEMYDYKLSDRLFFDISHDFYLGTATFSMGMIICKIIKEAKFCSLEELNSCISKFYFGTSDKPNRIKVIDSKISGNHMLGQHSEQCRSLIRYFPLIIHSIKELKYGNVEFTNDILLETMMLKMKDTMEIFENLRYIEELISSPYIDDNELLILDSLVKKHLMFISQNRPTLRLREHNMVHFSSAIRSYGPLCNIASLRYESFHQVAKKFCMSSNNKLNLPFTIMNK
uniref:NR LBD domain-containing protein n=1 Tax=Strongyloides papillosus TaxID=174720 RepID=A0A0N5BF17_STREA